MDNQSSELLEKIRQQFNAGPYPRIPLEKYPKGDVTLLYLHSLVTSYYLKYQKVIDTQDKVILDAGCGTGYKSLILATANLGAKVVGIDFSEESIKLAKTRLQYHGFENVEFHTLAIENLPQLNREFDYINCDDVLYLLPDPVAGLKAMKSVLKSEGILRANFHSSLQRTNYYRAQKVFKMMGLMDENPGELEIEIVRETMKALKEQVRLKTFTWDAKREKDEEWFLMNYLFQGDRGYTIPEMFSALKTAELEFISMVNWREWDLMSLFKEPDNLPVFLAMSLPETIVEDQLHLYELLNPIHRLLDFWCGHPNHTQPFVPVSEWQLSDWQEAIVHLHPQMKKSEMKEELVNRINHIHPFDISEYLPVMDSTIAACLLPLWESPQSMPSLVHLWQKLRPVHPVTLEPTIEEEAFEIVKQALIGLEDFGCVLLEQQP